MVSKFTFRLLLNQNECNRRNSGCERVELIIEGTTLKKVTSHSFKPVKGTS